MSDESYFTESTSSSESESYEDTDLSCYGDSECDENSAVQNPENHFRFDPLASDEEEENVMPAVHEQQVERSGNVDWCTCGRCRPMETNRESVCCREISEVAARVPEGAKCITDHPTFVHACLNVHALEVAYYTLREDRPSLVNAPDIHTRYRYTAYRQFVRWIWIWLGRRNRRVLPSCVVSEIRNAFPSARYAGFRYPE
ncbi:P2X purinoceptor 7-like [Dermacentor variabilis]|uniref:P2X purinoceptor 7-like n=1 Tax=Dermacentor variabilis TaxID=34621 RepID=UPI003F5BB633